jgi:integral membrane protein (TIGR01906 family)
MADTVAASTSADGSTLLRRIAQGIIIAGVPVLLVLFAVRLVMTDAFVIFEYLRPGFPEDVYGFTTEDRMNYGLFPLRYLLNGEDISYLSDLEFDETGLPLFNARELRHMFDVKQVTQAAFGIAAGLAVLVLAAMLYLRFSSPSRAPLRHALMRGAYATLALIASIVVLAVVGWDIFFTGFHSLFFADGTWQFAWSDTLIRLYPEQFWFDAAIAIGGLTVLGALLILLVARLTNRPARA